MVIRTHVFALAHTRYQTSTNASPLGTRPACLSPSLRENRRASIRHSTRRNFKSLSAPALALSATGRPTSSFKSTTKGSSNPSDYHIGSVAIKQQLRRASQAFLSTKKHTCTRIPIETLEGIHWRRKTTLLYQPSTRGTTASYIVQHCFGTSKAT